LISLRIVQFASYLVHKLTTTRQTSHKL